MKSLVLALGMVLGMAGLAFATGGHVQQIQKVQVQKVFVPQVQHVEFVEVPHYQVQRVIVPQRVQKQVIVERQVVVPDVQQFQGQKVQKVRVVEQRRGLFGGLFGR